MNLISFYAQEVREVLASIGARSLGRGHWPGGPADPGQPRGAAHLDDLDLNPLLITVDRRDMRRIVYDRAKPRQVVPDTLDAQIVADAQPFFKDGEKMQLSYDGAEHPPDHWHAGVQPYRAPVRHAQRLQADHLTVRLNGSAGQSLGAFGAPGLKIEVQGDANDYVGKGLSGATVVSAPAAEQPAGSGTRTPSSATRCFTVQRTANCLPIRSGGRAVLRPQLWCQASWWKAAARTGAST